MTDFFFSDPHLGHTNILKYCRRPFSTVEEMNQTIIDNCNKVAGKDDIIYCMGDFAFGKGSYELIPSFLKQIKAKVILIVGSHDPKDIRTKDYGFYKVLDAGYRYSPKIILSHEPFDIESGEINIHGHIHNLLVTGRGRHINVSVEHINYTPVPYPDIIV